MIQPVTLDALNHAPAPEFVVALGDIFEHAPWVAQQVAAQRPFETVEALHAAMFSHVANAAPEMQVAFIAAHPELAGKAAQAGDMTEHSISEQGTAGLDRLPPPQLERFQGLNRDYRARLGVPFIICVRRHTRASILSEFERRSGGTRDEEIAEALRQ